MSEKSSIKETSTAEACLNACYTAYEDKEKVGFLMQLCWEKLAACLDVLSAAEKGLDLYYWEKKPTLAIFFEQTLLDNSKMFGKENRQFLQSVFQKNIFFTEFTSNKQSYDYSYRDAAMQKG
ncbi:MAG: hypothetical protein ACHQVK_02020 [Candidatus Paceibacterales bacterium]